ncbi:hypothetical protein Syun_019293 [Stephania yunnanensis]|uniref:Uncharacterized protein n=1 Tax=Stephania yunnanensis TaxID=152371 RepID=A0AAP0NZA1_9MAGN
MDVEGVVDDILEERFIDAFLAAFCGGTWTLVGLNFEAWCFGLSHKEGISFMLGIEVLVLENPAKGRCRHDIIGEGGDRLLPSLPLEGPPQGCLKKEKEEAFPSSPMYGRPRAVPLGGQSIEQGLCPAQHTTRGQFDP